METGGYFRAVVDDLRFPPEDPAVRAALEAEADELGADELYRRLAASDPVAADRIEPGNVRRTIRALEVTAITGISAVSGCCLSFLVASSPSIPGS